MSFDPEIAAKAIARAHETRAPYQNLTGDAAPPSIADAYAAQEALIPIWRQSRGGIAGLKIATTTKVMQNLMGIDHPCGGIIFEKRLHETGVTLARGDFVNMVVECELAVRLGRDLPDIGRKYTRDDVRAAIAGVMAAFELIEDRNAVYKETDARTLIADNAWNGGVVLGAEKAVLPEFNLNGLRGAAMIDQVHKGEGLTDDPMGALAWVANLAVERGRPMTAGMVVITGSLIPTFKVDAGQTVTFEIDDIGEVALHVN